MRSRNFLPRSPRLVVGGSLLPLLLLLAVAVTRNNNNAIITPTLACWVVPTTTNTPSSLCAAAANRRVVRRGSFPSSFFVLDNGRSRSLLPSRSPSVSLSGQRKAISTSLKASSSDSTAVSASGLFRSTTPGIINGDVQQRTVELSRFKAILVKCGMILFIASMCIALPLSLFPQRLLHSLGLISRITMNRWALSTSQYCARQLLKIFPFVKVNVIGGPPSNNHAEHKNKKEHEHHYKPQPSIWVCNHQSMLDVFILLASDKRLRGTNTRPIKIVYWKDLEENPISKLMFQQCGFIPVQMAPNKPGENNEYDKSSFRTLLKDCKRAFDEGFDIGILPEGQLNPNPESGLLPIFSGAYTLAKMSRRQIHMIGINGIYKLWHPDEAIGMKVQGRNVQVRNYPMPRKYNSADEFKTTFEKVVGTFGTTGMDLPEPELSHWLSGEAWKEKVLQQEQQSSSTEEMK